MNFHIYLFVNLTFNTNQKLPTCKIYCYHLLELWTLWKLMNIKSNKTFMDVECGLVVWNILRHVIPFIWNKMLKLKTSKTICNHDV
jgi:hypothetical protein